MPIGKRMKFILLMSTFLILAGCGQPQGNTNAKISIASVTGSANYPGGLYLMAKQVETQAEIIKRVPNNDTFEMVLPNGTWDFKIIGWDGGPASKRYEGQAKCAYRLGQQLNGADLNVSVTLTTAQCVELGQIAVQQGIVSSVNDFYNTATNSFQRMSFGSCIDIKAYLDNGYADNIPDNIGCGGPGLMQSAAKGFRFTMLQKNLDGSFAPGLISECRDLSQPYRNYTGINLPPGGMHSDIRYVFYVYDDATCGGTPSKTVEFGQGIGGGSIATGNQGLSIYHASDPNTAVPPYHAASDPTLFVAFNADACVGGQLTNVPFAAGGGGKYLICTKDQWQNIALGAGSCPAEVGVPAGTMDCEGNAEYELGANIDFGGSNTTIANPISGEIKGKFKVLSNGNQPLFSVINNNNSSERMRISNLNIVGFNVSTSATDAGILAQNASSVGGTSKGVEIDNIRIDATSSITSNAASNGSVGGFIGNVNWSGSSDTNDMFFLRNVSSLATVNSISTAIDGMDGTAINLAAAFTTGGLIGTARGGAGNVALEYNSVGLLLYDPNDPTYEPDPFDAAVPYNSILGQGHVGGMIGYAENVEIRKFNIAKVAITAVEQVGGFVGTAGQNTKIENSLVVMDYSLHTSCTTDFVCHEIGGVVGAKEQNLSLKIDGVLANLNMFNDSGIAVQRVGGILGRAATDGSPVLNIKHVNSMPMIVTDGQEIGGIIGYGSLGTNSQDVISYSVVQGSMDEYTLGGTNNTNWGGIAGSLVSSQLSRNIVYNTAISASRYIGGAFGSSDGVRLQESYINVDLYSSNTSVNYIGGIAGYQTATAITGVPGHYQGLKVDAVIAVETSQATGCGTALCGTLIGENLNAGLLFDGIITNGGISVTYGDSGSDTAFCNNTACIAGTHFTSGEIADDTTAANCTTVNAGSPWPFAMSGGFCEPLFKTGWDTAGYDAIEDRYMAGSIMDPFQLTSVADWNAIGTDSFLLKKSYEIMNDINFDGQTFTPFGNPANSSGDGTFQGTLFGEGKIISPFVTGSGNFVGLINSCDGCSVGLRNDPVVFQDIEINCNNSNSCGTIGYGRSIKMFANVDGVIYDAGTPNAIGGLVGALNQSNNEIDGSSFTGSISGVDAVNVGGLVGAFEVAGPVELRLEDSFAKLDMLIGDTDTVGHTAGGFIGNTTGSNGGSHSYVKNSYVWLRKGLADSGGLDIDGDYAGGFFGMCENKIKIENSYVDFSDANLPATFQIACAQDGGSVDSTGSTGFKFVGPTGLNNTSTAFGVAAADYVQSHTDLGFGEDQKFTYDADGNLVREWEIFGHDN